MEKIIEDPTPDIVFKEYISLYRDDLDEIISVLGKTENSEVKILSGGYYFDNLNEIQEKYQNNIPWLEIKILINKEFPGGTPYQDKPLSIRFDEKGPVRIVTFIDVGSYYFQVKEILLRNKNELKTNLLSKFRYGMKFWSIDLSHRHSPTFYQRNKDKIIYLFLGGAIALLFKYIASILF